MIAVNHTAEQEHLLPNADRETGRGEDSTNSQQACRTKMVLYIFSSMVLDLLKSFNLLVVTKGIITEAEARELFKM